MRNILKSTILALTAVLVMSCSGELTDNAAPVELVVTNTQNLTRLDIAPNDDVDCDEFIGTINMQIFPKNDSAAGALTQVRVSRYRVTYRRTDGGTQVPASFVRSIDTLIGIGDTAGSNFTVIQSDALRQAPFAALQPQNGGRDVETGRDIIRLEVMLEVFGETLGGDNVSDSTAFPLEFCYDCDGCF
ncbi:MAG TPA: hypothetical protein VEK11_21905 [Thermoanaerobaculia bacterium]|jgi:hypothetical protein|nr:hypothetical protein [Thermoanaerobaculia bacterium]